MLIWRFYSFGYPTCHEVCARNCCIVLWDLGEDFETSFKMGLN